MNRDNVMPTVSFTDSLKGMTEQHPHLRVEMLEDALNSLLSGEVDEGRFLLRQYVNATLGFQELSRRTGKIDKNLMRTLGAKGNPTASNLFEIVRACVEAEGVDVVASLAPRTTAGDGAPITT